MLQVVSTDPLVLSTRADVAARFERLEAAGVPAVAGGLIRSTPFEGRRRISALAADPDLLESVAVYMELSASFHFAVQQQFRTLSDPSKHDWTSARGAFLIALMHRGEGNRWRSAARAVRRHIMSRATQSPGERRVVTLADLDDEGLVNLVRLFRTLDRFSRDGRSS